MPSRPASLTDAISRVIQGVLTGIGFLGAGVIVRQGDRLQVHGPDQRRMHLVRRRCVGVVCGAGHWPIVPHGARAGVPAADLRQAHRAVAAPRARRQGAIIAKLGGRAASVIEAGPHQPGK